MDAVGPLIEVENRVNQLCDSRRHVGANEKDFERHKV